MLRIHSIPLWTQKAGNPRDEYEDAFHPERSGEQPGECLRFAVADGATEGMMSGRWAALLCKLYTRRWDGLESAGAWLEHAYRQWDRLKGEYVRWRETHDRPVQWYEEPGMVEGAFSTLLGITFMRAGSRERMTWQAVALGDSCLFQVRHGHLILALPFHHPSQFSSRPLLISSNPARNAAVLDRFEAARGDARSGDRFYLMTDALAAWFLSESEARAAPWLEVDARIDAFDAWVDELRTAGRLRNDDVTCLRLQVN